MFGWDFIKALKPAKYKYTKDKESGIETTHFGVMAQDIDEYLKGVSKEEFAILTKDKNDKFMVDYQELIAPMISTIQELQKRVAELEDNQHKQSIHTTLFK